MDSWIVIATSSEKLRWIWGWINNHTQCWEIKIAFSMKLLVTFKVNLSSNIFNDIVGKKIQNLIASPSKIVFKWIMIDNVPVSCCCCGRCCYCCCCWLFIGFLFGLDYKAAIMSWITQILIYEKNGTRFQPSFQKCIIFHFPSPNLSHLKLWTLKMLHFKSLDWQIIIFWCAKVFNAPESIWELTLEGFIRFFIWSWLML